MISAIHKTSLNAAAAHVDMSGKQAAGVGPLMPCALLLPQQNLNLALAAGAGFGQTAAVELVIRYACHLLLISSCSHQYVLLFAEAMPLAMQVLLQEALQPFGGM